MIKRMAWEYKNFQMDVFIKATMLMGNLKERVFINGVTDIHTGDSGEREKDMELAHGMVQMDNFMRDNGDKESQMAQDLLQAMVIPIKDNLSNR